METGLRRSYENLGAGSLLFFNMNFIPLDFNLNGATILFFAAHRNCPARLIETLGQGLLRRSGNPDIPTRNISHVVNHK